MTKYNEIQNQFCSAYDKRKLCSYDIEFVDGRTKPLIHQTARFLYILQGKAVFTVDNKDYDIMEDSFIAILPWETTIIKDVSEPLQFIKIVYNSDFVNSMMKKDLNTSNRLLSVIQPMAEKPIVNLTKQESKVIKDIMDVIRDEVGVESYFDIPEEKELSQIYVTNKLMELMIQHKRYSSKKECKTRAGYNIELDNRPAIFKYIYSHLAEKMTIKRLSDAFFMSESSASKYIQEVTGLTFTDLVNEMRITKVTDMLTYTDLSLNDIAMMTGFSDASHLVRVFTAKMEVSPNEYRQNYKAKENILKEKDKSVSYEMINFINTYYTEDIRVTDIAERFQMTVVGVNRTLMYHVEKNFEELLHYLRINKACEYLLTTDDAIVDIALQVGYNTIKTFNRNFLRLKGMTPGEFRKHINLQKGTETLREE